MTTTNAAGHPRSRAWSLQQRANDGAWRGRFMVRSAEMLRALIAAKCGPIDADVAKILAALPPRVDLDNR